MSNSIFEDWEVLHTYSRADAIRDEVLHDVTELAKECGFRIPVAVSHTVWGRWIVPSQELGENGQSKEGRLKDVLLVLHHSIIEAKNSNSSRITFRVSFLMDNGGNSFETPELIAVCGPGDDGKPVITIMVAEDE